MTDILELAIVEMFNYAAPKAFDAALVQLKALRAQLDLQSDESEGQSFPTAALLGLGQCGTNVCLAVAEQLRRARDKKAEAKPGSVFSALGEQWQRWTGSDQDKALYLFEPVILLADLDQGQVQSVTRSKRLSNYPRCLWVDLDWLLRGGAGNVPQAAQYMTRVALKVPYESLQESDSSEFTSWKTTRSFFVDSAGAKENQTRLTFFLFSTGGGTGSGMSIEVGTAQGFLTHKRQKELTKSPSGNPGASLAARGRPLEACCSIGLGIMPGRTQEIDAQALNTGRVLCNYLARFGRFASVFDRKELSEATWPPFDALLLVSNEVVGYLQQEAANVPSQEDAERAANQYIAQQIFGVLMAQSLPEDFEDRQEWNLGAPDGDKRAPKATSLEPAPMMVDMTEFRRLDPADLKNSLSGITVVAHAQCAVTGGAYEVDFDDLLFRALSLPSGSHQGDWIEGISVCPMATKEGYEELIKRCSSDRAAVRRLIATLPLFRRARSAVTILSAPEGWIMQRRNVEAVKKAIEELLPNASPRRLALLRGTTKNVTLSLFVCQSGILAGETLAHFVGYLQNAFCRPDVDVKIFRKDVFAYLMGDSGSDDAAIRARIADNLLDVESPRFVVVGGDGRMAARATELEGWGQTLLGNRLQLESVFLAKDDCLDALDAARMCARYAGPSEVDLPEIDEILRRSTGVAV
jgi:hypothetical protein